jgi:hypothetical protein
MTSKADITGRLEAATCGPAADDGGTVRERRIAAADTALMRGKHQRAAERGTRSVGSPRRYKTPEAMQAVIDRYFLTTDKPTTRCLALALGLLSRQSFCDCQGYGAGFDYILKRARLRIESHYEEMLHDPTCNPKAAIFMLKRLGWRG